MISERAWARVGVVGAVLFALVGGAHAGDEAGLRVGAGRLTASGAAAETGATLRPGLVYEVPGGREALLQGPGGLSLRAMPGSRFQVLGVEPTPVGTSPTRDRLKHAVLSGYTRARNTVRRALGRTVRENGQPYAPA